MALLAFLLAYLRISPFESLSSPSPGIQSELRDKLHSGREDEKGSYTEQRLHLGIKGKSLL